jgi:hypothetical protein
LGTGALAHIAYAMTEAIDPALIESRAPHHLANFSIVWLLAITSCHLDVTLAMARTKSTLTANNSIRCFAKNHLWWICWSRLQTHDPVGAHDFFHFFFGAG